MHFLTYVIHEEGEDPEYILEQVNNSVSDEPEDICDEIEYYMESYPDATLKEALEQYDIHCIINHGEIEPDGNFASVKDGKLISAFVYSSFNFTDWFIVGGRWGNHLLLKNGTKANSGRIGDIDFDGMHKEYIKYELAQYDKFHAILAGRKLPHKPEDYNHYKYPNWISGFNVHPTIINIRDFMGYIGFDEIYKLNSKSREEFVKELNTSKFHKQDAISPSHYIYDSSYIDGGHFLDDLNDIDDDMWITVIDCHC